MPAIVFMVVTSAVSFPERASDRPSADWIIAGAGTKRLQQHPPEPKFSRIAKQINSDRHPIMAGLGLREISPEQVVPPRQIEAEIAVRFIYRDRVMHAMHVRCH